MECRFDSSLFRYARTNFLRPLLPFDAPPLPLRQVGVFAHGLMSPLPFPQFFLELFDVLFSPCPPPLLKTSGREEFLMKPRFSPVTRMESFFLFRFLPLLPTTPASCGRVPRSLEGGSSLSYHQVFSRPSCPPPLLSEQLNPLWVPEEYP